MKKAQISFEFMVLFAILLFIFISVAYLFPGSMEMSSSTGSIADNLARDIKVMAITASLSEADFESEMILPDHINHVSIIVEIHAPGDDIVVIKDEDTGRTLAKAFLPRINNMLPSPDNPDFRKLMIRKIGNELSIERISYP